MTERIISHMETADMEKKELGQQLVVAGRLAEIGEMSAVLPMKSTIPCK